MTQPYFGRAVKVVLHHRESAVGSDYFLYWTPSFLCSVGMRLDRANFVLAMHVLHRL